MPNASRRLLLRPAALGVARGRASSAGLAPGVTLGRRADDDTALYVRFDSEWNQGRIVSAFLLLDPLPGSPSAEDVALEVWRARRDFTSQNFAWSAQPGLAPPFARGISRTLPPSPVRVDVTELLTFIAAHPSQDHGFVVRASNQSDVGVTLATGLDGGLPPRLDVYLE